MLVPYAPRQQQSVAEYRRRAYRMAAPGAFMSLAPYAARGLYNMARRSYNSFYGRAPTRAPRTTPVQPVTIVSKKKIVKPRKPKTLKKQVKALQKAMNNLTSTLTCRLIDGIRILTLQNQAAYYSFPHNDTGAFEVALAQLRFFDPANPGTLVNASGATGTYNRSFSIKGTSSFTIRNNYQVPCEVRLYKYKVKADTNIDPATAFTNGLADIGNPASTSVAVYPSDVSQIKDVWTPKSCTIWHMKAGDQKTFSVSGKFCDYDPADVDAQSSSYQKDIDSHCVLFRVVGPPSHDKTTATQIGTIAGGVDVYWKRTYVVKYNSGGADIEYLYVLDNLDSQTAGPVVSQVVVDNQEYSTT